MDTLKVFGALSLLGLSVVIQIVGVVALIWALMYKLFNEEFAIFGVSIYRVKYDSDTLDCENHRTYEIINYDEFISDYLDKKKCHTFRDWGFLMDSDDFSVRNMVIGFKTKEDLRLYQKWYKTNKRRR